MRADSSSSLPWRRMRASSSSRLKEGVKTQSRTARSSQLAGVHECRAGSTSRRYAVELGHPLRIEVLELGDADAVLPGAHAAQPRHLGHDAVDGGLGAPHHAAVVGEDRDVDVDVAVAGVHVRRDDDAPAPLLGEERVDALGQGGVPAHQVDQVAPQRVGQGERAQLPLPGRVDGLQPGVAAEAGARDLVGEEAALVLAGLVQELADAPGEGALAGALLVDVGRLAEARELREALQRQDHVLVELEGVGARRDGAQLLAVGPEPLRLGRVPRLEEEGVGRAAPGSAGCAPRRARSGPRRGPPRRRGARPWAPRCAPPSAGSRWPARTRRRSAPAPAAPPGRGRGRRAPAPG